MNEPRPVLPLNQGQGSGQQGGHAPVSPRPAGVPVGGQGGAVPRVPAVTPAVPAQRLPGQPPQGRSQSMVQGIRPVAPEPAKTSLPLEGDDELIDLDDDDAPSPAAGASNVPVGQIAPASKIKFAVGGDKHTYTRFKRPTHVTGTGACRIRSFHGRLSDDGLAFMDDKINEWLDNHPEFEVKFVNCIVGPLEGKVTGEQGLIVTIWY